MWFLREPLEPLKGTDVGKMTSVILTYSRDRGVQNVKSTELILYNSNSPELLGTPPQKTITKRSTFLANLLNLGLYEIS